MSNQYTTTNDENIQITLPNDVEIEIVPTEEEIVSTLPVITVGLEDSEANIEATVADDVDAVNVEIVSE